MDLGQASGVSALYFVSNTTQLAALKKYILDDHAQRFSFTVEPAWPGRNELSRCIVHQHKPQLPSSRVERSRELPKCCDYVRNGLKRGNRPPVDCVACTNNSGLPPCDREKPCSSCVTEGGNVTIRETTTTINKTIIRSAPSRTIGASAGA